MSALTWDLFCRVVDHHGDVGVCWRLAADLAGRGHRVRLWIDDASALAWMAPGGVAAVEVLPWPADSASSPCAGEAADRRYAPGDVVVEAFGCELPRAVIAAMAGTAAPARPPVWINLEYLSAESWVERSHGLPSPQPGGGGAPLVKRFFFPGFSAATGGLIREPGLIAERQAIDPAAVLAGLGVERRPGERVVSVFCYEQPALGAVIDRLAEAPTLLLLTHGQATRPAQAWLDERAGHPRLRARALPPLTQVDYDRLLWCCDLNFVRGEDSFVRALWAGAPFVWQAYRQADDRHLVKVQAFLRRYLNGVSAVVAAPIERLWAVWNGAASVESLPALPEMQEWRRACRDLRAGLLAESDLTTRLLEFVPQAASVDTGTEAAKVVATTAKISGLSRPAANPAPPRPLNRIPTEDNESL